ncbi:hypothetical protein [Streptomyces anulatus]|uniref:hypothetical protein n=1 Tax=Streptomyces anulatus TaxID=1892 RepID=UPI001D191E6A|nr:hypothetical protein [Streptomyces anulatus]
MASSRWSTRKPPLKIKKRHANKATNSQETQQAVSISTATRRGKPPRTAKIHNWSHPFMTWENAGHEAHCYAHQEIGMKMLINVPELATELARPRHGDLSKTCSCD